MERKLGKNQQKWIDELRAGFLTKGEKYLSKSGKYSALGVACVVFYNDLNLTMDHDWSTAIFDGETRQLPKIVSAHLGLHDQVGKSTRLANLHDITHINDETYSSDTDFNRIADYIEKNAEHYFTESR